MGYRDPTEAARIRLDDATARRDAAQRRRTGLVEGIRALDEQLRAQQLPGVDIAALPAEDAGITAVALPAPGAGFAPSLAELVRLAGLVEADVSRLEAELPELERLFALLNDRAQGRPGDALPLSPAPRRVPLTYLVGEFAGSIWLLIRWTVFFPPVWAAPLVNQSAAVGVLAFLAFVPALRTALRASMLRWGRVADVRLVGEESTNTKMTNWPARQAHGWELETHAYTGWGKKSRLAYLGDDGRQHELVLRGIGYAGGVVLYDVRRPSRALAVESFFCNPRPDYQGNWEGGLHGGWLWVKLVAAILALGYVTTIIVLRLVPG